ncbi:MAG TPA: LPS assembly lipoprotein LptE [Oceanipulchritudo sp.]|nr:LPS assembly lipoprotein LptE [Oceanipulchritudo sp.]
MENQAGHTPIALLPVVNNTELPQIIAPLARNVREKIAHSPGWDLVGEDEAEVTLQITVTSFNRTALARDPSDTGRPLSYREVIRVSLEWISDLPPPWGDDPVTVVESDQILYAQPSLVNSEAGAMVEIADRLAEKIQQQLDWTGNDF